MQESQIRIKSQIGRSAETALVGVSVAQQHAELIESLGHCGGWGRRKGVAGGLQEGSPAADGVQAQAIVDESGAGIDPVLPEVVVDIPLGYGPVSGLEAEPGDKRRKPALVGEECDSGEINGGGKNIRLPRHQRSSKGRIEKVLLPQFPGDDFTHLRFSLTGDLGIFWG